MVKFQKTDMSEVKVFANRKFITMKERKTIKSHKIQDNVVNDYILFDDYTVA